MRYLVPSVLALLAGCGYRADHTVPELSTDAPKQFVEQELAGAAPIAWVDDFQDATLRALVDEAWQANPDLVATAARLEQARARARQSGASRLPELSATAGAGRSRSNPGGTATYSNDFNLGLSVSWEADVWGRLAAAARADVAEALAAEADLLAAHQSLAAQVAKTWFRITHDRLQLDLSSNFRDSAATTVRLVTKRYADGRSPAVDVRAARAQLERAEVDVAQRQKALQASQRDLELLLGRYPRAAVDGAGDLPAVLGPIAAGLPAELLLRRPDLQASIARLQAADQRVASSQADLLPRISLTASGGLRSDDLKDLVEPEALIWNLVANLIAPLFDGGRRRAVVDERIARVEELAANYARDALKAFREVEAALAIGEVLTSELEHQRRATDESHQVVVELRSRYAQGLTDGVILLGEQRQALNRDKELLALRLEALLNRIDLYLSLGGDATPDQSAIVARRANPEDAAANEDTP
ncbi:MAG: TolC family protein [Planctomycetota bacterium]|jgi:multidrug efflux system outer membrane protein|nr:TolC family protein [Planctomycetota bacterium]